MDTTTAVSTETLFVEKDEAVLLVATITSKLISTEDKDKALMRLRRIFDNYLECPSLLDHDVGDLVSRLLTVATDAIIDNDANSEDLPLDQCSHAFSAIYALCKVRGRKTIKRFLPHEVKDVEPVLRALRQLSQEKDMNPAEIDNVDPPRRWESLYVLWNWMETLSLVPFDCSVVVEDSESLLSTLMGLGKSCLSQTGPTREAAASCLAAWLSRPDLESTDLPKVVAWSRDLLQATASGTRQSSSEIFLLLGVLQTLVTILKVSTSSRENLIQCTESLWEPFILLADSNFCDNNLLLRKYLVKWWSRMGCLYLPPRVASWRYQRGRRSLERNLQQGAATEENSATRTTDELCCHSPQHQQDDLFYVPDYVEDAMGYVLQSLRDSSTTVRWPAAKGVGRLTERLPPICADDVLDAVLELFVDPNADQAWHGGCLALAELARRGLLLPHRLPEVVPQVVRAIQYDVRRGQTSVGAHVRDAACYTYWSFARAYHPKVLRPHVAVLSESIVLTCLFDREVNCRRAASAAFQECVGRQGADNFKHGISILTAADYFAIGNRTDAFTRIAFFVAQYEQYRRKIVCHVHAIKLQHWDESIRILASKSLHGLAPLDKTYVTEIVFPSLLKSSLDPKNVQIRHGSILGLAEGIHSLGGLEEKIEESLSKDLLQEIAELVPTIEKRRLYRGRGGEMVRGAVCRFIQCICEAEIPLIARQQVRLLDTIDACLPHPNEGIQGSACEALGALTYNYFPVGPKGPSDRLQKRVIDKYLTTIRKSENPASTRGFTLALGHLPRKLLAPTPAVLDSVVRTLSTVSNHNAKVGREKDAETRRNALIALRQVCQTVGFATDLVTAEEEVIHNGLNAKAISFTFEAFFKGLDDYNVDRRRGDVGSWCRIEAMKGLEAMACLVAQQANANALPELLSEDISNKVLSGLLKQFSEKLDNVRVEAGKCLQRLLTMKEPEMPFVPEKDFLKECLGLASGDGGAETVNWADASVTFPMVAKVASRDAYFPAIISGMVISVGGLTESVTKQSTAAFLQLVKEAKGTPRLVKLGDVLLDLFQSHSREVRVILPLLKSLDILLSHQCLDELLDNDDTISFKSSLMKHISKEAKSCNDMHRQFACIDVALGLVGTSSDNQQDDALAFACAQLLHRFPRVRRYSAEHIYVCLLERPELLAGTGSKFSLEGILDFAWDGEKTSAQQCREMAQMITDAVGVTLPDIAVVSAGSARSEKDDFATYSALVDSVARG